LRNKSGRKQEYDDKDEKHRSQNVRQKRHQKANEERGCQSDQADGHRYERRYVGTGKKFGTGKQAVDKREYQYKHG
jgi:hypothetical protein